ncbi:quorum-sensing phosphorelay protein LuxU [Vibrio neptunius]|uniref:Phosphorelay protein LuxU n=1 Tax=Vibrio neptunius TaxID=170651 RepID=A0ABS3A4Z6_9VIBR|nr:quorum-sensing phosphorelay protein LuxU [Vibrio neptunius]MBN3494306.1 Hpt domain-containing protein [Vibrio neptunius]MBN3516710.1 Hpt domain-containing protein [Vibrio neptunius]MBN3550978.1 Hpt domain-containing protein [Vibrio neptunius]MBN3579105.1 Hpt domain-containing protein [Vibrio neptunius]MCH9872769.1 Hpt domain-containing protein [Vibrio neptunius]
MMEVLNQTKIDRLASEIGADNVPILLDIFLGELVQYIEKLSTDEDLDKDAYLKEISHALKSSAASFGAESLCAYAVEVDAKAKSGQQLDVSATQLQMVALLSETQQRYRALLTK